MLGQVGGECLLEVQEVVIRNCPHALPLLNASPDKGEQDKVAGGLRWAPGPNSDAIFLRNWHEMISMTSGIRLSAQAEQKPPPQSWDSWTASMAGSGGAGGLGGGLGEGPGNAVS